DDVENGEPRVIVKDPDQFEDVENEPEEMDLDEGEDGGVAELGEDEEIGFYLDPELEPNSEDE
ncbi:hypothetical protein NL676_034752, partial [Syzygium grande]